DSAGSRFSHFAPHLTLHFAPPPHIRRCMIARRATGGAGKKDLKGKQWPASAAGRLACKSPCTLRIAAKRWLLRRAWLVQRSRWEKMIVWWDKVGYRAFSRAGVEGLLPFLHSGSSSSTGVSRDLSAHAR